MTPFRILLSIALTVAIMSTLLKQSLTRPSPLKNERALVIAHRGYSGARPEHTIAAYDLALQIGADYIEQDIVSTKDGELVVLHDRELGSTTNIAEKGYNATKKIKLDRTSMDSTLMEEDFFVEDFTLDELKALRVRQRFDFRETSYDFLFPIHTLEEVLRYAEAKHRERALLSKAPMGLYIELKHPSYFDSLGLVMEEKFLKLLIQYEYVLPLTEDDSRVLHGGGRAQNRKINLTGDTTSLKHQRAAVDLSEALQQLQWKANPLKPIIIQCFEGKTLKYFRDRIAGVKTIHLIKENLQIIQEDNIEFTYADLITDHGLKELSTYADGIGPHKSSILTFDAQGKRTSTGLVKRAHDNNLIVHPYTFRSDYPVYFKKEEWGMSSPEEEVLAFLEEGIDGLFSDHPEDAVLAVDRHLSSLSVTIERADTSVWAPWFVSALTVVVLGLWVAYNTYKYLTIGRKL